MTEYIDGENISYFTEEEKISIKKKEERRLKRIFKDYSAEINELAKPLIERCAFMFAELKEAEIQIQKNGSVELYKNGKNQWGKKKSASVEVHNLLMKTYTTVIKQLIDLLPKKSANEALDEFKDLLKTSKN